MNDSFETFSGIKVVSLVFAFIGAALGISYTPEMTKRTAFAAIMSGLVCGALGPEAVAWYLGKPIPLIVNNAIAVVLGILGMFFVPAVIAFGKSVAADPWGLIDRLRGKS